MNMRQVLLTLTVLYVVFTCYLYAYSN